MRREILTDELLELPSKVAQIIEIQRQMLERLDSQDGLWKSRLRLWKSRLRLWKSTGEMLGKHGERLGRLETVQQQILERLDGQDEVLERHTREISELRIDVSRLNGRAAMEVAKERFELIAMEMGLDEPRMLSLVEIAKMAMSEEASEYTARELNSFRDCDIIISATSPDVGDCYVPVQVSMTVDHGDISRAIAHARMANNFTGLPAYPAVAGFNAADVAEGRLAGASVHWHRMPLRQMNPR